MLLRRFPVVALSLLLASAPAFAQVPSEMPAMLTLQGTVRAFAPGKIQVVTPTGQQWIVHVSNRTSVMITGKADAAFLQPGMYVKFRANVTGRQKAAGLIDAVQVFTPTRFDTPGAIPVARPPAAAEAPPADPRNGSGANEVAAAYDVVGRITAVQRGRMVVSYGNGSLQVEPAPNLQVDLALADIRFARPGDQIVCTGALAGHETARATSIQIRRNQPVQPPGQAIQPPGRLPTETRPEASEDTPDQKAGKELKSPDQLVKLLTLPKGEEATGETFTIEGDSTEFRPCVKRPATALRRDFGPPVKKRVRGTLSVRGHQRRANWQMWTWGSVKVIVDPAQKTRFLATQP